MKFTPPGDLHPLGLGIWRYLEAWRFIIQQRLQKPQLDTSHGRPQIHQNFFLSRLTLSTRGGDGKPGGNPQPCSLCHFRVGTASATSLLLNFSTLHSLKVIGCIYQVTLALNTSQRTSPETALGGIKFH